MALGFTGGVVARSKAVYEADLSDLKKGALDAERTVKRSSGDIEKHLRNQEGAWDRTGRAAGVFGKAAGIAFAAAGTAAVVGIGKSIQAASNLEEQLNKTRVVFGSASKDVIAFSETTASSLGISQRAALEAAGTFGNMLVPMGFAREEAAQMSTRMVALAADMASFNNASPVEVLEAMRAALAGETEPLRRFGVFLNDARLKQEALTLGLYNGKGALDASAKAAATYSIVLKDTRDAQGDFDRTSGSLANQQRILKAELENAGAAAGKVFLPAVTSVLQMVTKVIPRIAEWVSMMAERFRPEIEAATRWLRDELAPALGRFFTDTAPRMIERLIEALQTLRRLVQPLVDAVGGWEQAAKLAFGAVMLSRITKLTAALGGAGAAAGGAAAGGGLLGILRALTKSPWLILIGGAVAAGTSDPLADWATSVGLRGTGSKTPQKTTFAGRQAVIDPNGNIRLLPETQPPGVPGLPPAAGTGQVPKGAVDPFRALGGSHPTSGLAGFKGADLMAPMGTVVAAPEDGRITRLSGNDPNTGPMTNGGARGYSIYFIADSGRVYFITHMMYVNAKGRYSRGDPIGVVGPYWDRPHAHVGISSGFAAVGAATGGSSAKPNMSLVFTGQGAPPGSSGGGRDTGGEDKRGEDKRDNRRRQTRKDKATLSDLNLDAFGKTALEGISSVAGDEATAEQQQLLNRVTYLYKRLSDLPADARRKMEPGLRLMRDTLRAGPLSDEILQEFTKRTEAYNNQAGRVLAGDQLTRQWQAQRARLTQMLEAGILGPEGEKAVRAQIQKMDKVAGDVTKAAIPKPGQLDAMRKGLERGAEILDVGFKRWQEVVDAQKARLEQAWSRVTEEALRQFDAQTAKVVAGMRVQIRSIVDGINEAWEFGDGLKTPSELILEKEESARAQAAQAAAKKSAQDKVAQLTAAVADAEAKGAENVAEIRADLASAQAALDDLLWGERRAALQTAAEEERRIGQEALTEAQGIEQERRRILRGEFEAELQQLGVQVAEREITYGGAMEKLRSLFQKYEVPFEAQGGALTTALGIGMQAAMAGVETAISKLVEAVDRLNKALGEKVGEAEGLAARARAAYGAALGRDPKPGDLIQTPRDFLQFAEGGEVHGPTRAIIGEGHSPEFVLPWHRIPAAIRKHVIRAIRRWLRTSRPEHHGGFLHLADGGEVYPGSWARNPDMKPLAPGDAWPAAAGTGSMVLPEEAFTPTQAQLYATYRSAVWRQYGGDLYPTGAAALNQSGVSRGNAAAGAGAWGGPEMGRLLQQITMIFQQPPADPWVYFERARYQAQAANRS